MCVTVEGHLRETEEESGGPDQEGGGGGHRDISAGSERAGRSGGGPDSSPDPTNTETWHGRKKERKTWGRKGVAEVEVSCLPLIKRLFFLICWSK